MADRPVRTAALSNSTSPQLATAHMLGRDSDDEEVFAMHEPSDTESEGEMPLGNGHNRETSDSVFTESIEAEMQEGMLPRDLPKRTAFHSAVAERQLSQADAKQFYHRSQTDLRSSQMHTAQISPGGSPLMMGGHSFADPGSTNPAPPSVKSLDIGLGHSPAADTGNGYLPRRDPSLSSIAGTPSRGGYPDASYTSGSAAANASAGPRVDTNIHHQFDGAGGGYGSQSTPTITAEQSIIFQNIQKLLDLRHKYIQVSLQGPHDNPRDEPNWSIYPPPPEPAWTEDREKAIRGSQGPNSVSNSLQNSLVLNAQSTDAPGTPIKPPTRKRKQGQDIGEDFNMEDLLPLPGASEMTYAMDDNGVYQVYENANSEEADIPILNVPTIKDYYMDLDYYVSISTDGPSKSYAFRRLQILEAEFSTYILNSIDDETADSKRVPHRDFYNVRKVDTHVHHSACMNQKHLLRFIKSKMKKFPDEIVLYRDDKHLTLAEVFESINLTAYDLSIDTLDMHAHKDSFHRFDKFNLKYNPIGESRLRTIFLKTDNFINGRYLAEITKEVISDLESSKYQMVEWRISIYGKSLDEWDKLAAWVVDNKLFSHNVRWLIQIPRLYDVYKASGLMHSFDEVVRNIFQPLFEVTRDPNSHPKLHVFLQRVVGFDSVDDESKVERRLWKKFPIARLWDLKQNPPYTYWIYYLFANMTSLNHFRKRRGFNTFVLRPHCGEAGDSEHLSAAALCCHSISHGLLLRKVPVIQYIFYLDQIGIAMSPLSNNALFLPYERNPFWSYFKRGLNVSLSTDDPLQFAFTKEPLIEEYAVAAQIYKLSPVDMCELAKNSVRQSGYESSIKQQWLGPNFHLPGAQGNAMVKTNVPNRREEFRFRMLAKERKMVERGTAIATGSAKDLSASVSQLRSPALSAKAEPRYLPAVAPRRRDSTRQNSQHETDENAGKRRVQ